MASSSLEVAFQEDSSCLPGLNQGRLSAGAHELLYCRFSSRDMAEGEANKGGESASRLRMCKWIGRGSSEGRVCWEGQGGGGRQRTPSN